MNDGLKQRIIGALVLIALGVIFLPVLFDKERIAPVGRETQIPLAPDITPAAMPAAAVVPAKKDPMFEKPLDDGTFEIDEVPQELSRVEEGQGPSVDSDGVVKTWVLQVASYKSEEHARDMRDKLIADGFKAFTKNVETDKGLHTRLYVGPSMDQKTLLADKTKIDPKYGVQSVLAAFKAR